MAKGGSLLYLGRKQKKERRPTDQRIQTALDSRNIKLEVYRVMHKRPDNVAEVYDEGRCLRCSSTAFSEGSRMYKATYVLLRRPGSSFEDRQLGQIHFGCIPVD